MIPNIGTEDVRLCVRDATGERAACSLWWTATPRLDGRTTGLIGHYARTDAGAADLLLAAALQRLCAAGCELAAGPVDGSTWHRYRFVTDPGARAAFAFEPQNPAGYPDDFERSGFTTRARYVSAEETQLDRGDERVVRARRRLHSAGVTIRPIDLAHFDAEIAALHPVANAGFADALLFSPIDLVAFANMYRPLRASIDPHYVRIAECAGRIAGFGFAFPDRANGAVIAKTFARLPDRRFAGLGAVLLDDVRRIAYADGYARLIHALMRADNASLNTSLHTAHIIRRYGLFVRAAA